MNDWNALIREHGPSAFQTAWRILGHLHDVEDVVQEAFLEVFRTYRRAEIRNWPGLLQTSVTCRSLDRLRKRKKVNPLSLDLPSPLRDSPELAAEAAELANWLRTAVAELPPRQAEVFSLHHFADLSRDEIAAELVISPEAVSVSLNKARNKLQNFHSTIRTKGLLQ